jgi:benzoyl-CoA reductase/2-hydroxyglutaryl-CoA dehydratase subunit BcrC/BadD/HgdB
VPRELLYALGCTPVRVFPTAEKPTAAEAYLPRNFCALARLILAGFVEDDEPGLDAVIFADEDDATRRLYDVWRACVPVPVWGFVEAPRAATPLAARRYADTLARLAADTSVTLSTSLEAHTGRPLTADGLRQAITLYNEQRSWLADLKRRWLTGIVDTITYRRLRRMALTGDPVVANEQLRQALREHDKGTRRQGDKETRRLGNAAIPSISPPLLVSPSPHPLVSLSPSHPRLLLLAELAAPAGLVRLVESHGARIVAEDSDLDERDVAEPVPAEAGTVKELLLALAQAYLARPPGPRMRDLPRRLEYLSGLVTERRITGAICAYSKFCDLYLAEFPVLQAHLKGLGVPVLLLELEDEAISGQHRTRVEAFLEMISGQ